MSLSRKFCYFHHSSYNLLLLQDADLVSSVLYFFKTFLDIQLLREDLKACHSLGKCSDINKTPPIVVKFVYFHQQNDVYVRRSMLGKRGMQNPINTENIYVNERIPKEQLLIKKYASDKGLITTTCNCDVKLFLKHSSGATFSQKVTSTLECTGKPYCSKRNFVLSISRIPRPYL